MFKDYDKYLSTSLKVYLFLLVAIFIMKIVGLDYFGLDMNNKIIANISNFMKQNILANNLLLFFPLVFNQYVIVSYTCDDNSKKMLKYNILLIPIFCLLQGFKIDLFGNFSFLVETLYVLFVSFIYCKITHKKLKIKRFVFIMFLVLVTQMISMLTRYNYSLEYVQNPIANFILNLDYLLMLFIIYKINFMKGGSSLWVDGSQEVQCSSLQKKKHFSSSLKDLQKNYSSLDRVEKATFIIYTILSLLWNLFTVFTVLFIAKINDTVIECIFIMTSFWISKRVFGKPFHLKSMMLCFVLSNATYYVLNRITTPIGISIFVPIMLGVALSYITSKFVRIYKPLYKGMPIEEFDNSILRVVNKGSDKYNICYDFFIEKQNAVFLGRKYHYTEAGIRKITSRINSSIKALK